MARKPMVWLLSLGLYLFVAKETHALEITPEAGESAKVKVFTIQNYPIVDIRVQKLRQYLARRHAPLTPYAEIFVLSADRYQLDWRLVPAIAGVESSFGQHIPKNSYNAWGWNNGRYQFTSWPAGITHVNKTLREKYYDRGLTSIPQISRVYAPPSHTWATKVNYFIHQIEPSPLPFIPQLAYK